MEPALPLLPGPGRLRPRRLHPPRARRRLRRPALARGLQRRLPPGRPGADGRRRACARCCARGRARLPALARRAAALRGYAFVELAVEPARPARPSACCTRSASPRPAQHRTKPVSCGGRADARVLLNAGAAAAGRRRRDRGRERRPGRLGAARRGAARAGPRPRDRGPARPTSPPSPRPTAPRSSSAAPTSASGELARRTSTRWPRPAPGGGRRRAHRPRRAGPAVRLLRRGGAVLPLGARARAAREPRARRTRRADPQPRRVTNGDGSVRLALNVPAAGRRPAHPAGLQHVAFACDDVLAAAASAARARRRAARDPRELLRRPRRPLRARPGPDRGDARARRPLRPRRAAASSCTSTPPIVGGRLFFEVVQRRGAYDGYGAANSPVRMAAQRAPVAVEVNG